MRQCHRACRSWALTRLTLLRCRIESMHLVEELVSDTPYLISAVRFICARVFVAFVRVLCNFARCDTFRCLALLLARRLASGFATRRSHCASAASTVLGFAASDAQDTAVF